MVNAVIKDDTTIVDVNEDGLIENIYLHILKFRIFIIYKLNFLNLKLKIVCIT